MTDKMVRPLFEREAGSAPGPFYVVKDQCITCSLPTETAPENINIMRDLALYVPSRAPSTAFSFVSLRRTKRLRE